MNPYALIRMLMFTLGEMPYFKKTRLNWTVMAPPAVTLTFGFLTPKSNQHIYEPKYICDQNWLKFPSLISEIWCSRGFQEAQTHGRTLEYRMLSVPLFNDGGDIKRYRDIM